MFKFTQIKQKIIYCIQKISHDGLVAQHLSVGENVIFWLLTILISTPNCSSDCYCYYCERDNKTIKSSKNKYISNWDAAYTHNNNGDFQFWIFV
jgi:hypothetical protein